MKWVFIVRALALRIYSYISDPCHSTMEDLKALRYAISYAHRPLINRLKERKFVPHPLSNGLNALFKMDRNVVKC